MAIFKKGELTKIVDEDSKLIPILKKDGWVLFKEEVANKVQRNAPNKPSKKKVDK